MDENSIIEIQDLGFQWNTDNPFLFCVHHKDAYPKGNGKMGPDASLDGRRMGNDFTLKDGWRMYHGQRIPGFPQHPHRGFETITIVLEGMVDHDPGEFCTACFSGDYPLTIDPNFKKNEYDI